MKWKIGQLYPIPKSENWSYNLSNVRPIVLLEAFRKVVVQVLGKRLDKVLSTYNILKGPNYAGLSGCGISSPIHIMNNMIKEAREKNKEIWILFQDMKKAFDSVSLEMLEKALRRKKLPSSIRKFVLSLFDARKIRVITSYGLTQEFTAEDGLDQGEVISPLLWRIFYDPLLCEIQNKEGMGYKMSLNWPTDLNFNQTKEVSWRQGVLAYADDTTWVARSKEELSQIIKISDEFYELNDIEINGKKSELLVINPYQTKHQKDKEISIEVGKNKDTVYAKRGSEAIRHLGVWLSEKGNSECNTKIIAREVTRMCKVIRFKRASVSQLVYMNNSVLLPSIEFRLQTSFLSKNKCDQIQRPIWMLIKNKMELARSVANSICSHNGLFGLRSIWQNQIAHHTTELTLRLNQESSVGITTRLRLKDAQIKCKSKFSLLDSRHKFIVNQIKNNLTYNIIQSISKLGFSF